VGGLGHSLLALFFAYFLFMIVAQFLVGQLALVAGGVYLGIQTSRNSSDFTSPGWRSFLVASSVGALLGVALVAAVGSGTACDSYYIGKVFGSGYGPEQNGAMVTAENHSNVCSFPGFRHACSQFDECRKGVAFFRPLPIFLFCLLCVAIGAAIGLRPGREAQQNPSIAPVTTRGDSEFFYKVCRKCFKVNLVSRVVCSSCGAGLPSVQEILTNRKDHDERQRREQLQIEEQKGARKVGIEHFGSLIESRAKAAGDDYLPWICAAYLTGRLSYQSPIYFSGTSRETIYIDMGPNDRFTDIAFPTSYERAKRIAIEAIRNLYVRPEIGAVPSKIDIWQSKIRIVYGYAELFPQTRIEKNGTSFSTLYSLLLDETGGLFSQVQRDIALWEIERHVKHDRKPAPNLENYLKQKVPFFDSLTKEFLVDLKNLQIRLIDEKLQRRLKRAKKKKLAMRKLEE